MSEHYSRTGPICPYCDHRAHADEAFFFDEDFCEYTCGDCDKNFSVSTHVQWSWTTRKTEETSND